MRVCLMLEGQEGVFVGGRLLEAVT